MIAKKHEEKLVKKQGRVVLPRRERTGETLMKINQLVKWVMMCSMLLLISSAAGYERRRQAIRATYLEHLEQSPALASRVSYRFLLGAPKPEQEAVLAAEQAEFGDLLQVGVPESYETLFPKVVAAWRWAVATHEFGFWMHADDDSYVRLDLLLDLDADLGPHDPRQRLHPALVLRAEDLVAEGFAVNGALAVVLQNLRAKLGDEIGEMIETVRGFGYRFTPASDAGRRAS